MKHPRTPCAAEKREKKTEKTAPPRPVATSILIDPRRVAFLYGALAIDQRTVAELLRVPIAAIERHVRERKLVRGRTAWPYSVVIARDLARIVGATLPDLKNAKTDEEWAKLRSVLAAAIVRELKKGSGTWFVLDPFLWSLPYRLAAASARLSKSRLEFLAGDLAMSTRDIATLLAVAPSEVLTRLASFRIEHGSSRHDELSYDSLRTLANMLGLDEWSLNHEALSRFDRVWSAWRKGVRDGLLRLAARNDLDLAVLDDFIAKIPHSPRTGDARSNAWARRRSPRRRHPSARLRSDDGAY